MSDGERRVQRGARRARRAAPLARLVALLSALSLFLAVLAPVRYFYCRMTGSAHLTSCCPGHERATAHARELPGREWQDPASPCCERRETKTLSAPLVLASTLELSAPVAIIEALLPQPWQLAERAASWLHHWPIRAGPSSVGELLAMLQVFLN